MDYGLIGIAIATNTSIFLNFIILHFYLTFTKNSFRFDHWISLDRSIANEYVKLGFSTSFTFFVDAVSMGLLSIFANKLGVIEAASHVILNNTFSVLKAFSIHYSHGTCVLVGRNIGKMKS